MGEANMIKKAVVLLSGGLDSTTCLSLAISRYGREVVTALTFDYGQKHNNELDNAQRVAERLGVELVVATVDPIIFKGSNSTLLKGNNEIAHESYEEQLKHKQANEAVDTYVPFRNGLMLSQATALAYSEDGDSVVMYGAHADDAAGSAYPDCSIEFFQSMDNAIRYGTLNKVQIEAPFISSTKADIVVVGLGLKTPYELTRSCYEGRDSACGECGTCIDRINAFKELNEIDPIKYESKIEWGK